MAPIASRLPELGSPTGIVLLLLAISTALYFVNRVFFSIPYPPNVPFLREPEGKQGFSLRTRLAYYLDCQSLFHEAYHNYAKKGKAVIIPGILSRHEIILPVSSMKWLLAQPDNVFNVGHAFNELDQAGYSLGYDEVILDGWQGMLVKTELNAVLQNIVQAMNTELGVAFDRYFGTDTGQWKRIDLLATMRLVVAQAASRFTVGLPLCRDEQYLNDILGVADGLVMNAGITGGSPPMLRPVIGPLAAWNCRRYARRVKRHFKPLFEERLALVQRFAKDDPAHEEPQDHLQMMMRFAQRQRPEELHDLDLMSARLCAANFGSIHQTSIQATHMLLNILGSDAEYNTVAVLRDEISRVFGPHQGGDGNDDDGGDKDRAGAADSGWTKAKVVQMVRADSVARETLRLNAFGGRSIFRKVMVDGVTTDGGVHLPRGSVISFLSQPAQVDEATFEDPLKYDPFRFSRIRESSSSSSSTGDGQAKPGGAANLSFVATSPDYMAFSHGRHACPGRFLVEFELKFIVAYLLTRYDLKLADEYNGRRPENRWVAEALLPPAGAAIMVKRKEKAALGQA